MRRSINLVECQELLKTHSLISLAKHYGFTVDYFRTMLRKLGVRSPRTQGQRVGHELKTGLCACGRKSLPDRTRCSICRSAHRRKLYADQKAAKSKINKI